MPTETEKAYMAGIVDGEGAIYISRSIIAADKNGFNHAVHNPEVAVGNTDLPLIEWCRTMWPSGRMKTRKPRSWGNQVCHQVIWRTDGALALLDDIMPYLRIKIPQAELCREFILYQRTHKMSHSRDEKSMRTKSVIYDERERMRLAMIDLNTKGNKQHSKTTPMFTWGYYEGARRECNVKSVAKPNITDTTAVMTATSTR